MIPTVELMPIAALCMLALDKDAKIHVGLVILVLLDRNVLSKTHCLFEPWLVSVLMAFTLAIMANVSKVAKAYLF